LKLQEFQAKRIFGQFGIPVPSGEVATTPLEARRAAEQFGGPVVVKSQVLVGGRGKAGGIKLAKTPDEAEQVASRILGMDIKGLTVKKVLVDPAADIKNEIYFGIVLDRAQRRVVVMASAAGGIDIEEVAAETPEKIITVAVDPCLGLREYQARDLAIAMGLPKEQIGQFSRICQGLYDCYMAVDANLAEINPLAVLSDGTLKALDGKIVLDDSALFRHPDLAAMRDEDEETSEERKARENGLSFVKLDGEIGCMVNGAGPGDGHNGYHQAVRR
jgi:succinyl-CoA synthetase beta subunit